MTPLDAKNHVNHLQVYIHIRAKGEWKRKYPPLVVGSKVRTYLKPHTFKKGYHSSWSENIYDVISVSDDNQYEISNNSKRKYNRWELLLVPGIEDKNT